MKFPEQLLIATDELCCRQTLAARTRAALLKLEHQVHQPGRDSCGLAMFKFEAHRTKHYIRVRPAPVLTALLLAGCARTGDVGESLALLADAAVDTRRDVDRLSVLPAGADAEPVTGGHEFYGYALRLEGFGTPDPLTRDSLEAARAKRLHEHPDRVELRMVCLVARDGLRWMLTRVRGQSPQVVAMLPESDIEVVGLVMNALGRLTNAVTATRAPGLGPDT